MPSLRQIVLTTSLGLGLAQAQQEVLTLPFFGYDNQPIVASVIEVQNAATILSLQCAPGTDGDDCGLAPDQTLIYGPSTYNMLLYDAPAFAMTQDCSIAPAAPATATEAVCAESASGSEANSPGSSTATYGATDISYMDVTVTGGAALLASAGSSTTPAPGATTLSSGPASPTTQALASSTARSTTTAATSSGSALTTGTATGSAMTSAATGAAIHNGPRGAAAISLVGALIVLLDLLDQ